MNNTKIFFTITTLLFSQNLFCGPPSAQHLSAATTQINSNTTKEHQTTRTSLSLTNQKNTQTILDGQQNQIYFLSGAIASFGLIGIITAWWKDSSNQQQLTFLCDEVAELKKKQDEGFTATQAAVRADLQKGFVDTQAATQQASKDMRLTAQIAINSRDATAESFASSENKNKALQLCLQDKAIEIARLEEQLKALQK